jgi:hypothetical protein
MNRVIIIILAILIITIVLIFTFKKHVIQPRTTGNCSACKEKYTQLYNSQGPIPPYEQFPTGPETQDTTILQTKSALFPPTPPNMPESGYSKLVSGKILSDTNNLPKNPSYSFNSKGEVNYSDKLACNTPSEAYCVTNDSCAQYGIGEKCEGPEGYKRCVCESALKSGEISNKVPGNQVIIGYGAVCTSNNQCITNFCNEALPGMYSKYCDCSPGYEWDQYTTKCRPAFNDAVYKSVIPPIGSCPQSAFGTLCTGNAGLPKGMACNRDGYAICMLSDTSDNEEYRILNGGNCESSDECYGMLTCDVNKYGHKVCICPKGTGWDERSYSCTCPDAYDIYDPKTKKCYKPGAEPHSVCVNSRYGKITPCTSDNQVGMGEHCDPSQHVVVCDALSLPYNMEINMGGRCKTSNDCKSGVCRMGDGTVPGGAMSSLSYCQP